MSLEEFFNENSLGDSAWDEEDINLDAISSPLTNTTSIDVLKHTPLRIATRAPEDHEFHAGFQGAAQTRSPPYIVKFAHLPSQFTGPEIEDLFQTKCTKFIKFKIFWELNKKPSMGVAFKNSNVFDANFTRASKVAFTELYSARDLDKILSYWTEPLKELYEIIVTPADFADFMNYMEKTKLLSEADDPTRPYKPRKDGLKTRSDIKKTKNNPFGTAHPVDEVDPTGDVQVKLSKMRVHDDSKSREVLRGAETKTRPDDAALAAAAAGPEKSAAAPQPLSYSAMLKKSVDAAASASTPVSLVPTSALGHSEADSNTNIDEDNADGTHQGSSNGDENDDDQSHSNGNFTFKDNQRKGYQSGTRGRGTGRGGRGGRSDNGGRGDHSERGERGERGGYRGRGGSRGGFSRGGDSDRKFDDSRPRGKFQSNREDNPYSVFRPASGFLRESTSSNGSRGGRGGRGSFNGDRGRGGSRGGRGDRRGFTAV